MVVGADQLRIALESDVAAIGAIEAGQSLCPQFTTVGVPQRAERVIALSDRYNFDRAARLIVNVNLRLAIAMVVMDNGAVDGDVGDDVAVDGNLLRAGLKRDVAPVRIISGLSTTLLPWLETPEIWQELRPRKLYCLARRRSAFAKDIEFHATGRFRGRPNGGGLRAREDQAAL